MRVLMSYCPRRGNQPSLHTVAHSTWETKVQVSRIASMADDGLARAINPSLELLLVSRNLERVADLATNIGEDAVFLAEGKQIKHHFEERSSTPAA